MWEAGSHCTGSGALHSQGQTGGSEACLPNTPLESMGYSRMEVAGASV